MSRPAILVPRARAELREALRTIGRGNMSAARAMNDAVELAARRLGENPALGHVRPFVPAHYRFCSLTRFAYLLVYDSTTDPVRIVRLAHTARDLPRLLADLPR